ncbi:ATP-dependent DNA/RNA helicase DHX36 [Mobula birostris]|uniref:ATP-dependent DNA/RNA helicase DHX36 n=1 Tax=Mobula birostris TaxID=1983395 RepID=UPI003B28A439
MSSGVHRDWRAGGGSSAAGGWDNSSRGGGGGGGGGGRGRHPGHLKGKDIGLWYAKRQGQKSKEMERKERAVVHMDEKREEHITRLLNSVQTRSDYKDQRSSLSADSSMNWRNPSSSTFVNKELKPETSADLEYLFETITRDVFLDEELREELSKKMTNSRYLEMKKFREKLPSYTMKHEVVDLINTNQVVVISGETGCGKTTQVTQFILDDYIEKGMGSLCRIVCTQPRRISAISIAERVAAERAEVCGEGNSTGYQIRLQSRFPRKQGSILYCTTGIILQWLQSDSLLSTISHLVLDEVHERSLQSDVLMTIVKDVLAFRSDLKVILMSATLNAEQFSEYFGECEASILWAPCMDGAILVFLPGWDNISTLNDLLTAQPMFKSDRFVIIPLHSLMPSVNQTEVFKKPPPGVRKIVIATNIAETSITIDDVVHVIDGGKIKETHFDTQNNISTMAAEWVSKANAKQRKGRAGRVQPGSCYHLYDGLRESLLDDYQLPEIMRTPLEELCLQIKILHLGPIAQFLGKAMQPPSKEAVHLAVTHLKELNALDKNEDLTPLGVHLARLPVEPHIGKMILFGALLCCLDPVLTIAASLSFKDPFVIPLGKEKVADAKRRELSKQSRSDHLTVVNAFKGWEEAKRRGFRSEKDYCWEYFLSPNNLQMLHNMKGQFTEHLLVAGFVSSKNPKDPKANINSENEKLIKAVVCAGLYPKVAKIRPSFSKKRKMVKVFTKSDGRVNIHPKSVNAEEGEFQHSWLIYHLKMRTSSIYLYDCTEVSPYSLLFFGGDISIQKEQDQETIAVDEWIVFQSPSRIAHLVKDLKKELDTLLQEKIKKPRPVDWNNRSKDFAVLSAIIDLITTQDDTGTKNYVPRFQSY